MPAEALACTLPPQGLQQRIAWIQDVTARGLVAHELTAASLQLRYRLEVAAELAQIVAGERACCAFLQFELQQREGDVVLTLHAPAGIGADARWLFEQFLPKAEPAHRRACGCAAGACT